jgi:hypothetical protein
MNLTLPEPIEHGHGPVHLERGGGPSSDRLAGQSNELQPVSECVNHKVEGHYGPLNWDGRTVYLTDRGL